MAFMFPSEEWIGAYKEAINSNPKYKEAGAKWTHGAVALICKAYPAAGLDEDAGIYLDLNEGVCLEAKMVPAEEALTAPFCITGEYARWKQVVRKELEPVKGMMQGKLRLKGNLPTIVRFVKAAQELVESATMVDTQFLDE